MDGPTNQYPPLPPLQGELVLEIYTHKSLGKLAGIKDSQRYVLLGSRAFELAVTHCIFKNHPNHGPREMENLISKEIYQVPASQFMLREKSRYNPADRGEVFAPEGARGVFPAYIGGVHSQPNGHQRVKSWVTNAFFPFTVKPPQIGNDSSGFQQQQTPWKNYLDAIHLFRHNSPPILPLHKPNNYSDAIHLFRSNSIK